MNSNKLKVLLIIEQCNPDLPSVPLVGYQFFNKLSKIVNATLVTHERNKQALEKVRSNEEIVYIPESTLLAKYYHIVKCITIGKRGDNWPLLNKLAPIIS